MKSTIFHMDCRDAMSLFIDPNSVDSIVTDPPYGLGFMGKEWDHGVPGIEFWKAAYDVLKPGGHLLAFSGSRTYHRMVCAIEDAGFEIRDQIMWVYGSGFPKSLDVSKAIDKAAGVTREIGPVDPARAGRLVNQRGDYETDAGCKAGGRSITINPPATEAAQQWQGWGTALKPAHEPICVARKPLIGTVAANVLHCGTGGLNIDACRVAGESTVRPNGPIGYHGGGSGGTGGSDTGRWPANLIHDGSPEVLATFPDSNGSGAARLLKRGTRDGESWGMADKPGELRDAGAGSAARFFYCAKASKKDRNEGLVDFAPKQQDDGRKVGNPGGDNPRNRGLAERENHHPTVKPTDLMAYLCRLVTSPGGTVLDPFSGSGSTGKAAVREGFNFIGCELDADYVAIAEARIAAELARAAE